METLCINLDCIFLHCAVTFARPVHRKLPISSPIQLAALQEPRPSAVSRYTLVLVVLVFALIAQLFLQRQEIQDQSSVIQELKQFASRVDSAPLPTRTVYKQLVCPNPVIHYPGTLFNPIERNMPLVESARKVVDEFEFSADALNKGVKEFLQEMGKEAYNMNIEEQY